MQARVDDNVAAAWCRPEGLVMTFSVLTPVMDSDLGVRTRRFGYDSQHIFTKGRLATSACGVAVAQRTVSDISVLDAHQASNEFHFLNLLPAISIAELAQLSWCNTEYVVTTCLHCPPKLD